MRIGIQAEIHRFGPFGWTFGGTSCHCCSMWKLQFSSKLWRPVTRQLFVFVTCARLPLLIMIPEQQFISWFSAFAIKWRVWGLILNMMETSQCTTSWRGFSSSSFSFFGWLRVISWRSFYGIYLTVTNLWLMLYTQHLLITSGWQSFYKIYY